ncbi:cbb3-type cytochrome oxidase subunit 3 [Pusillimonas noertemannii]|uniref:Cytochrome c oxidase cbb3-type subunit 4 n=1 Tax=Pusillimonas noertemannii TaxID=305977 RepID=A0A2U1CSW3_9BURK|nr:CcoQ/FixQ family Cbb3-type cytochrome c oxidase assembly chaperone [Pusillimonas noertemannii]NYT70503.1 CcoQ/FixQ family Cbb3-type cytochrome c oxidase assembly chaperone [Pusillimonas noertemannii]PVY68986.1 cytochrome c oxidase cbb3-type subunit 4 [Pusillimonas noertemannii]TFL11574.1 CcoQ/FixQ family Cbb3-type cytochrome c oxidase assembly chaperone [Pusillimonas noertemannii]
MSMLNGIATLVALLTFIGIVWWAYSRGRSKANRDASMLPFAQPDEAEQAAREEAEEKAGEAEKKKQGESHE